MRPMSILFKSKSKAIRPGFIILGAKLRLDIASACQGKSGVRLPFELLRYIREYNVLVKNLPAELQPSRIKTEQLGATTVYFPR